MTDAGPVKACENLRPGDDGVSRPVGELSRVATGGWRPLHDCMVGGERALVLVDDAGRVRVDHAEASAVFGPLPGRPCAAVDSRSGIYVVTEDGDVMHHWLVYEDGRWIHRPMPAPVSPLGLTAVDKPRISSTWRAVGLDGSYTPRSTTLSASDRSRLTQAALGCHWALWAACADKRQFLQPVMGYYRIVDAAGCELYRSMPTVLCSSCGANFFNVVEGAMASTLDSVATLTVDATPYRVALRRHAADEDGGLLSMAARVEVWLTRPVDPVATCGVDAECRLSGLGGTSPVVELCMPGVSMGMTPVRSRQVQTYEHILPRLDAYASLAASVDVSRLPQTVGVMLELEIVPGDVFVRSSSARVDLPAGAGLADCCRVPHTFGAASGCGSGATVMWGGISPRLFSGYSPAEMARDVEVSPTKAVSVVEVGGMGSVGCGSAARMVAGGDACACRPLTLAPLVCYPLPWATSMRVDVGMADGTAREVELPLRTLPGCRYAFHMSADGCPVDVAGGRLISGVGMPDEVRPVMDVATAVMTTASSAPWIPVDTAELTATGVTAVASVPRASASWNYAHSLYYAFTMSGSYSVKVDRARRIGAPVLLDMRPVAAVRDVAVSPRSVYVAADGDLVEMRGTVVSTLRRGDVRGVGYCGARDELWVAVGSPSPVVYPLARGWGRRGFYTRSSPGLSRLYTLASGMYVADFAGNLYAADVESAPSVVGVSLMARLKLPARSRVAALEAVMAAARVNGALSLRGDGGAGYAESRPIVTLRVDGAVDAPLAARVVAPLRRMVNAHLSLSVSPDFEFHSLTLSVCHDR